MSSPFDPVERALVRAAVADPADRTTWLVYADWLDDHDKPDRAEFLRLQVRLADLPADSPDRPPLAARAAELRPLLHPLWVAFFDRPPIENCDPAGLFAFECPQRWDALTPTGEVGVRHCGACDQNVHYCHDLTQARYHASLGRCVTVAVAVPRRPGDLTVPPDPMRMQMLTGVIAVPEMRRAEMPWHRPAAVPDRPRRRPWWRFW